MRIQRLGAPLLAAALGIRGALWVSGGLHVINAAALLANNTLVDNSSGAKQLQFDVANTVVGAAVTLYADGVAIGDAVAAGTVTIPSGWATPASPVPNWTATVGG